ncbi:contractile injection system tape measure protein [Enterobacter roggenkampii]|nr:contractile injection system tape measure protein [Enterobacter roggenkampii]
MRREWAGTSQARKQMQSLLSLTKTPNLFKAPLRRWLRSLWLNEELTAHVRTDLPAEYATEWERQLIGLSDGDAAPEFGLSANSRLPEKASSIREIQFHTVRSIKKIERGDIANVVFGDGLSSASQHVNPTEVSNYRKDVWFPVVKEEHYPKAMRLMGNTKLDRGDIVGGDGLSPTGQLSINPTEVSNYRKDVWFPVVKEEHYPKAMRLMSNTKLDRVDIVGGDGLSPTGQLSLNSTAVSKYNEDVWFPGESLLQGECHLHMMGLDTGSDKSSEKTVNNDGCQQIDRSNAEIPIHGISGENTDAIARQIYKSLAPDCRKSSHAAEQVAGATYWHQINDAGLVLLWPFMPELFRQLGLLKNKRFINTYAQHQAALCLDWLSRGESEPLKLPTVSRRLCGLSGRDINEDIDLEEELRQKLSVWLADIPRAMPAKWQKLSSGDLRQWFLQRPGWCSPDPEHTTIYVQPAVFDVLFNDWSWPTELVALPWLERPLTIRWSQPL